MKEDGVTTRGYQVPTERDAVFLTKRTHRTSMAPREWMEKHAPETVNAMQFLTKQTHRGGGRCPARRLSRREAG